MHSSSYRVIIPCSAANIGSRWWFHVVSMSIGYLSQHCSKHLHADLGKPPRAPSIESVDFPAAHGSGHRRVFFQKYIPSGNLLHSYWKWPIFRWFTYETWWFSIAMLVYQRVIQNHHVISYNDPMKMIIKPLMIINPRILPLISTSSLGFSSPFSPLMRSFASVSWPRYRRDLTAFVCSYRCLGYPTSHSFGDVW